MIDMQTPQMNAAIAASEQRYRTLLEINNAIITNLTKEGLLTAICEAVQHVLPVYRAALNLYDPDTDTIRIHALSTQWNSDYFRVGVEMDRVGHGKTLERTGQRKGRRGPMG